MKIEAASRLRAKHDLAKDEELRKIQKDLEAEGLKLAFNDSHLYIDGASIDILHQVLNELKKDGEVKVDDGVLDRDTFALKRSDGLVLQKLHDTIRLFYTKKAIEASLGSEMSMRDVAEFLKKAARSHRLEVADVQTVGNQIVAKVSNGATKAVLTFDFNADGFELKVVDSSINVISDIANNAMNKRYFEGPSTVFEGGSNMFSSVAVHISENSKKASIAALELHKLNEDRSILYLNLWSFITAMQNFYAKD